MHGEFSRAVFHPKAPFHRLLHLQGRPLTDADLNENIAHLLAEIRGLTKVMYSWHFSPNDGMHCTVNAEYLKIDYGDQYVNGLHAHKSETSTFPFAAPIAAYFFYIEVFDELDWGQISRNDPGIDGLPTSLPAKVAWNIRQSRLVAPNAITPQDDFEKQILEELSGVSSSKHKLSVTVEEQSSDPLPNALIRVEVFQNPDNAADLAVKWIFLEDDLVRTLDPADHGIRWLPAAIPNVDRFCPGQYVDFLVGMDELERRRNLPIAGQTFMRPEQKLWKIDCFVGDRPQLTEETFPAVSPKSTPPAASLLKINVIDGHFGNLTEKSILDTNRLPPSTLVRRWDGAARISKELATSDDLAPIYIPLSSTSKLKLNFETQKSVTTTPPANPPVLPPPAPILPAQSQQGQPANTGNNLVPHLLPGDYWMIEIRENGEIRINHHPVSSGPQLPLPNRHFAPLNFNATPTNLALLSNQQRPAVVASSPVTVLRRLKPFLQKWWDKEREGLAPAAATLPTAPPSPAYAQWLSPEGVNLLRNVFSSSRDVLRRVPAKFLNYKAQSPTLRRWLATALVSELSGLTGDDLVAKIERSLTVSADERMQLHFEADRLTRLAEDFSRALTPQATKALA